MLNKYSVRDFFRARRVNRYEQEHGQHYHYHGLQLTLPTHAGIGPKNAILRGRYENAEIGFIEKYLPDNLPVIELGGSLGVISQCIGSRLGPQTKQIVVEANPNIFAICETNAVLPERKEATILINKAIAYGASTVSFEVSSNVHANRLATDKEVDTVTVDALTLRVIVEEHVGPNKFVLIMDIEGGEFDILQNDLEVFQQCELAIIEIHPQYFDTPDRTFETVTKQLQSVGMSLIERNDDVFVFRRTTVAGAKVTNGSTDN